MSRIVFAGAAFVAAILSTPASSTPIAFDFSGVVTRETVHDHGTNSEDLSRQGQSFTARVVIDTDLLTLSSSGDTPGLRSEWRGTNLLPEPSELTFTINGAPVAVPTYEQNMYSVTAQDGRMPPGCTVCGVSDSVSMIWRSQQAAPTIGQQLASTFSFLAYEVSPNSESPSYINLDSPFDFEGLLTMPLPNLTLQLGSTIFDCEGVNLCFANYFQTTWFSVTSVTRTDLSVVTAVPEPGTLGLLAAGLLGVGFARRRSRPT